MIQVNVAKWRQTVEDVRLASVHAAHPRRRERFQALDLIASGQFTATTCAAHIWPTRRDRTALGSPLQSAGPQRAGLSAHRGARPLFSDQQIHQLVDTVVQTTPRQHGLPGAHWTVQKLKPWVAQIFGRHVGRNTLRRVLRQANLTWKKVKKLLGRAKPAKRAAHIQELLQLFASVCQGQVSLIYVDEVHIHRDLDLG